MDTSKTSCIDFISSVHGEQRRRERDIDKRDLQAAVRYGSKKKVGLQGGIKGDFRWKYTFAEVVYITDNTSTKEITSWTFPLPLQKAPVDSEMKRQMNEQKNRLTKSKITSHTILIVDQSESMNNADVPGHRSRSRAVFYNIANEIIAAPLLANQTSYTDVVTLIEMRDGAAIHPLICRAPINWDTYNTFVELADDELRGKSNGNYIPALELVNDIVNESNDDNCAVLVFFLSDGKPSDHVTNCSSYKSVRIGNRSKSSNSHRKPKVIISVKEHYENDMLKYVKSICLTLNSRLTFGFMGFANASSDFSVLKKMSNEAKCSGAKESFFAEGVQCGSLRGLLSTLVTSLTDTRSLLGSILLIPRCSNTEMRRPGMIKDGNDVGLFIKEEWSFYGQKDGIKRLKSVTTWKGKTGFVEIPLLSNEAKGIAIKKNYFGEGSERIVHKMMEVDINDSPLGDLLVLKINRLVEEGHHDELLFHEIFGRTQQEASRFATKFNERLNFLGVPKEIPRILFLDCSYYTVVDDGQERGFLVEKRLDVMKFKKWSDNKGGVHNIPRDNSVPCVNPLSLIEFLSTIQEEDEDKSDEDTSLSDVMRKGLMKSILYDDIPPAFSHYTYVYSKRDRLVCDIQGVLHDNPPLFELTDPAIHSQKKGQFGKTDFGCEGVDGFFKSHICNPLCKVLFPNSVRYL